MRFRSSALIGLVAVLTGCSNAPDKALVACKEQYAGKLKEFDYRVKIAECMDGKGFIKSGSGWEEPKDYTKKPT